MKRRTVFSAFVTLLVAATAAMAYFFVAGLGEGEHTAELGKGTASNYPVAVSFADGLTPGAKEPVTLMLEPATATDVKAITLTKAVDPAHATAGCEAKWFTVSSNNGNGTKSSTAQKRRRKRRSPSRPGASTSRPPSRTSRWNSPKRKPTSRRAKERTSRSRPSRPRKPENERSARRRRPLGGHERRRSPDDHEAKGATARAAVADGDRQTDAGAPASALSERAARTHRDAEGPRQVHGKRVDDRSEAKAVLVLTGSAARVLCAVAVTGSNPRITIS